MKRIKQPYKLDIENIEKIKKKLRNEFRKFNIIMQIL